VHEIMSSPRVLIVDDENIVVYTLERMLTRAGFQTESALSGKEAEERLQEAPFDVAIVDLFMPEVNGFQLLEWMKVNAPDVVAMVLSGTQSVLDALKAVEKGAFDFVSKPIENQEDFIQHIERAVEHKNLRDKNLALLGELKGKNEELENRLKQLELAHSVLQSQAVAMQVDLNRAMRIQQGLLPREAPFAEKVNVAAVYQPRGKVGGDLYDIFRLDDHLFGAYIADTSGHGVSSAMLTIFLKHAMQGLLREYDEQCVRSPDHVLNDLNQIIINEAFGQGIFVSMTYLVLDMQNMAFRYSNAGHPPILIKRADGSLERLHKPAPVLGVNPNVTYTGGEGLLHPGEALVMYTDGVTEARNTAGEFFGDERLKKVIQQAETHSDSIAHAVEKQVANFCEGRQHPDDLTLLSISVEPQREPIRPPEPPAQKAAERPGEKVTTTREDGRTFISVSGMGSWKESQQVLNLCEQARKEGVCPVVLDLAHCLHLDSTFLGVLHNITTSFSRECKIELQNCPRELLQEMSDLGLTDVLTHFRPEPVPLPESMKPVPGTAPAKEELGRLLLWAHEALVDADPTNADRFAAVLKVLHDQAKRASWESEG